MQRIQPLLIGGTGITASQIYNGFIAADPNSIVNVFHIVVQILIGLASIYHLFKPKPDGTTKP